MPNDFTTAVGRFSPRAELESRAGVESLEDLQEERRRLVREFASLDKLFGNRKEGWQAQRRAHRDGIATTIERERPDEKMAENKLERLANADDRHSTFVANTEGQYDRWFQLRILISEVEERIESRLAEIRFAVAEARLAG
jgi:hypothetical protein